MQARTLRAFLAPLTVLSAVAVLSGSCASGEPAQQTAATADDSGHAAAETSGMVSAANPMAVEAGLKILRAGGNALDAAVAVQATLGLVEPQSSGIGGGAFMTYYDAKTKQVTAYDGRETAPASATQNWFMTPEGRPMAFPDAVRSGKSTGVPGAVAMLSMAHAEHGKMKWKDLFGEAERLATDGFPMPNRMAAAGGRDSRPDVQAYIAGRKAGDIVKNPEYAATIRKIAAEGPKGLLEGEVAQAIVDRVAKDPVPGGLTLADLKGYKPKKTDALCRPYRVYIVCVPPAPSGGPGVLMALGIFENTDIASGGPASEKSWYLFAEGQRLMYADRDHYVGDPAYVRIPIAGLLDSNYLKGRAALIGDKAQPRTWGTPIGAQARAPDTTNEPGGTSHFVIVDRQGNAVSMTTTVEGPFGAGRMVKGFVLNNELTDFALSPTEANGALAANAPAGGKRPRSSMAPVIVLDKDRRFVAAFGSPGGNAIPAYNLKALVGFIDWNLSLQDAFNLPNVIARGPVTSAEAAKLPPGVLEAMRARGLEVRAAGGEDSGLHGVVFRNGKLEGAADVRREGVALTP